MVPDIRDKFSSANTRPSLISHLIARFPVKSDSSVYGVVSGVHFQGCTVKMFSRTFPLKAEEAYQGIGYSDSMELISEVVVVCNHPKGGQHHGVGC